MPGTFETIKFNEIILHCGPFVQRDYLLFFATTLLLRHYLLLFATTLLPLPGTFETIKFNEAIRYYEPFVKRHQDELLKVSAMALANLCVSYIMTSLNEKVLERVRVRVRVCVCV